jgi:hypothetical protein
MEMNTGNGVHADITDAAGDLMIKQMTNNTGMFETTYYKGKDIVREKKLPGYHIVEIGYPEGGSTTYKKVGGEYYIGGFTENGMPKPNTISKTKPEGWFSVEDEIGKSISPTAKNKPAGTMEMMTDDLTPSQRAFKYEEMSNTLADKPTYGEYTDAKGNRFVSRERYADVDPEFVEANPDLFPDADKPIVRKYNAQGDRIPVKGTWSKDDPTPLKVVLEHRLGKEKYELYLEKNDELWKESGNINQTFVKDPTVTIKRVQEMVETAGRGDSDLVIMEAIGTTKKGESVTIQLYGDGVMKGFYKDSKGKTRTKTF